MLPVELQNQIVTAFYKQFPESNAYVARHALGGGFYISCRLGKPTDWPNGIAQNDPLTLTIHYWPDDDKLEITGSLVCKPKQRHLFSSTHKFRKTTIKRPATNLQVIVRYFESLKTQIWNLKDDWHPNDLYLIAHKLLSTV